jgi:hypothetical protein
MQKRASLLLLGLLVIVTSVGIWYALTPRHGMTKANFRRIQVGMTLEEVEEILGRPPCWEGDEIAGALTVIDSAELNHQPGQEPSEVVSWRVVHGDEIVRVAIRLDERKRVLSAYFYQSWSNNSVLGYFYSWLAQ